MIYPKIFNNFSYIINKKTSIAIIVWILFLIVGLTLFLLISFTYKYHIYDSYLGYIKKIDNSFYTIIYVPQNEISDLSESDLVVDKKEYSFKIINISEEYYTINNNLCYQVILDFNLSEKYLIENNIIEINFRKEKTTIFKEIKKGIKLWIS